MCEMHISLGGAYYFSNLELLYMQTYIIMRSVPTRNSENIKFKTFIG